MSVELFVYGTLRRPAAGPPGDTHYHSRIASGILSARSGRLRGGELIDLGAYPGLRSGSGVVVGEVFTVSDEMLETTDQIEGHPDFYTRRIESIELEDGTAVDAWVYWAPVELSDGVGYPVIASGDWFDRTRGAEFAPPVVLPADAEVQRGFDRLEESEYSWLSTVRPSGRPHAIPMWHVVVGNRIYFATRPDTAKVLNIATTPHVVVTHPDAQDVVIVEGWAIEATHLRDPLAPLFGEKYDWDFGGDEFSGEQIIIEVTPRVFRSWHDQHTHRRWNIG